MSQVMRGALYHDDMKTEGGLGLVMLGVNRVESMAEERGLISED